MAYSYFPATYQPYQMAQYQMPQNQMMAQQQMQPQLQQQMPQQQQPQPPAANGIIWVSGYREAANYPVAPNNAVPLWDSTASVVYMKKADQSGKPVITVYDLVERPQESVSAQTDIDKGYATKSDLKAVLGVVGEIDEIIKALNSDVEEIQAEMAKRKGSINTRAKKATEVINDD